MSNITNPEQNLPVPVAFLAALNNYYLVPADERVLIPASELPAIIQGLENALVPMARDRAKVLLTGLLAGYSTRDLYSEEGYCSLMLDRIARYPYDVARQAINTLIDTSKFLPRVAEFVSAADAAMLGPDVRLAIARHMQNEHRRQGQAAARTGSGPWSPPQTAAAFQSPTRGLGD